MSLLLASSGDIASRVVEPEGVDFDGVNDYLDIQPIQELSGKEVTISAFLYIPSTATSFRFFNLLAYGFNYIEFQVSAGLWRPVLRFSDTSGVIQVNALANSYGVVPTNTWFHFALSFNLGNVSQRKLYINRSPVDMNWSTYNNNSVVLQYRHKLMDSCKGRLQHYTFNPVYTDLSIPSNLDKFVTSNLTPSDGSQLTTLLHYLPMKDAATAHINEGTGGNFVQNGTLGTASRGANQDNCKASYFDGTADYLSRTSLTGIADGKVFTFSCNIFHSISESQQIFEINNGGTDFNLQININRESGKIAIYARNQADTIILNMETIKSIPMNASLSFQVSIDLTNVVNRHVVFNGKLDTTNWYTYTNDSIDFTDTSYLVGRRSTTYYKGTLGELYFDTKYIDLATNNPFWDSVANRPKPVRQVIAETGITPLIAMPLDASNAGKNYGTGGGFTANSAPYVGARGGSEFWARSVKSNLIAGSNLSNTSNLGGVADGKTFSAVVIAKHNDWTYPLVTFNGATENICLAMGTSGAVYSKEATTSNYNLIMSMSGFVRGAWNIGFISVDLTDTNKTFTYLNGTTTTAKNTFVNSNIGFSETTVSYVGKSSTDAIQGENAYVYFTTDYIDFSQEANRLKFIDGLGYPKDLKAQIDAGVIPKPLIYLPFSDPTNLGKNLGTGGDFTVNGTVTQGADVNG